MQPPVRPPRPRADHPRANTASPLRSCLALMLALSVGFACVIGLALLSMGYAAAILGVVMALFGVIAFHYVVWGWWLRAKLMAEQDTEYDDLAGVRGEHITETQQ